MSPTDFSWFVALLLLCTWLIWRLPTCVDPECVAAHRRHDIASRVAAIEAAHTTFHDPLRPQAMCSLCQKRDDGTP